MQSDVLASGVIKRLGRHEVGGLRVLRGIKSWCHRRTGVGFISCAVIYLRIAVGVAGPTTRLRVRFVEVLSAPCVRRAVGSVIQGRTLGIICAVVVLRAGLVARIWSAGRICCAGKEGLISL